MQSGEKEVCLTEVRTRSSSAIANSRVEKHLLQWVQGGAWKVAGGPESCNVKLSSD